MTTKTLQLSPPVGGGNHHRRRKQLEKLHTLGIIKFTGTHTSGKRSTERRYHITTLTGQRIALRGGEIDAFILGYRLTTDTHTIRDYEHDDIEPILAPVPKTALVADGGIDNLVF